MQNIAVFGGSFDPPHLGHLEIIQSVFRFLTIEKLFVVPAFLNPFKTHSLFSPQKRLEWLKILTQDMPLPIEILDFEINQNKPTPTIETINFIQHTYKPQKIYLILGADNLKNLTKWHQYKNLKNQVEFVIIPRAHYKIDSKYQALPVEKIPISSTQIKEMLDKQDSKASEFIPKMILNDILKETNCKTIDKRLSILSNNS